MHGCEHCHKLCLHFYDYGRSCLHFEVAYFTIMASTCNQKQRMETLEPVQIQKPEWKHPNIGYIDHDKPIIMINGRQHNPSHWDYPHYDDEYVDVLYVQKMEDVLKSKCTIILQVKYQSHLNNASWLLSEGKRH